MRAEAQARVKEQFERVEKMFTSDEARVFRQGDTSDSMYAVISGELDVFLDEDGPSGPVHTRRLRKCRVHIHVGVQCKHHY